ncbi:hypothetical protein JD969_01665 [Planctomycetota bacterium]|nr:hypothetical protein JD969_01665 [Planctomycetota bacterium]
MRQPLAISCAFVITIICTTLTFTSHAYAGFLFEFDYVNQGKGGKFEPVEGGKWVWESNHIFWGKSDLPPIEDLMATNSIRTTLWKTNKYGDPTKHYVSIVSDVRGMLDQSFLSDVARINMFRDTKHGLYANFDYYDSAGKIKDLDNAIEGLFEKVMKQDGKGALGWTQNMVMGGVWAILKKFTPLDKVDFLLDPIFSGASFTAYIPNFEELYPDYEVTKSGALAYLDETEKNRLADSVFANLPIDVPLIAVPAASPNSSHIPEPATASLLLLGLSMFCIRPKHNN